MNNELCYIPEEDKRVSLIDDRPETLMKNHIKQWFDSGNTVKDLLKIVLEVYSSNENYKDH